MKTLAALLLSISLAGCASLPVKSNVATAKSAKHQPAAAVPKVEAPAPVVTPPATPNQAVKKRWYDRFKKHPRWFHSK